MNLHEIIKFFETQFPTALQEEFDNCGLQVGNPEDEITGILLTLDVTPEVIKEAVTTNCNLIVSHHPVTLSGIKRMTGNSLPVQIFREAIRNEIAIYSVHTNIDNLKNGISGILAQKLGLINTKVLSPKKNLLLKLVTFVPLEFADKVRNALFEAGAGRIGNYSGCSYNIEGEGTFCGDDSTNPFVGKKGELHFEKEIRIETILPSFLQKQVLKALFDAHPYEEVAYDLYPLENQWDEAGIGIIGELAEIEKPEVFLKRLKEVTKAGVIRHSKISGHQLKKVAICGGSGSFLINDVIKAGADIFITGDIKYHQFFDVPNNVIISDIGHYESEQFFNEFLFDIISKNFPTFAVRISEINSNPIKYFS
ncbi:MAG: Nif3-like dinuclear metal center hexameric protein [Marinilabiliaceae bacterium]|nr:Nif3-like dinuclear metal center hexameric protein [Marinilabiliaceae bacterium]